MRAIHSENVSLQTKMQALGNKTPQPMRKVMTDPFFESLVMKSEAMMHIYVLINNTSAITGQKVSMIQVLYFRITATSSS